MATRRSKVYRADRTTDAKKLTVIRRATRRSYELLEQTAPDTFLGRKTQEPFPIKRKPLVGSNLTEWEKRFLKVLEQRYAHLRKKEDH